MKNLLCLFGILLVSLTSALAAETPASGPDVADWRLWARAKDAATVARDDTVRHDDQPTLRVEHTGAKDWSLEPRASRFAVAAGDMLELSAWLRVQGEGEGQISFVTYDKSKSAVIWLAGMRSVHGTSDWKLLTARLVVPKGVAEVAPRLTGSGPATVWLDAFSVRKLGNIADLRAKGLADRVTLENPSLAVTFDTTDATLSVLDKRSQQTWRQRVVDPGLVVLAVTEDAKTNTLAAKLLLAAEGINLAATIRLDGAEVLVSLVGDGDLPHPLAWPSPFLSDKGTYLVIPMNEGISYPVADASIEPGRLVAYGGHGICMSFWGVTDGEKGHMAIIETPDDAAIRWTRIDGELLLAVAPEWESQKGKFGYQRRLRYVFLDRGGHVAMCKRYREYVRNERHSLVTLDEKRKANPNVDLLIGAVNVWCWDKDPVAIVKQLQAAGIERILWSTAASADAIKTLNDMPGVLASRYDIYQDVMDPANFKRLQWVHPDWTTAGWPGDLCIRADGQWARGWEVETKDGGMLPCGVLCDRQAIPYAEKRVSEELKVKSYRCRFIDTTTAASWRECYSPDHPMTRTQSRESKMKLLELMSDRFKLVTGSETGHDAAVPYVHYFEGMLSLGPYRVPDSGRDMMRTWDSVPEPVAKFQVGWQYRLPLWELVYHDCVVAQWYWGDYNNKLPGIWDKRDLFNVLYGTPPMFMFDAARWQKNKDRFVQTYRATCPVARAAGYSEMVDHRFLTPDRSVQQTRFANGVTVTVNFSDRLFILNGQTTIPAGASHIDGLKEK
jgi:hypothetical protein